MDMKALATAVDGHWASVDNGYFRTQAPQQQPAPQPQPLIQNQMQPQAPQPQVGIINQTLGGPGPV